MATVRLRSPLREVVGGNSALEVEGKTLGEVVRRLQEQHPRLTGWILDERGSVREHVKLFVNGDRAELEAPLEAADRVDVLGAISGGAEQGELLVGTRKGLYVLRGPRGLPMEIAARRFSGQTVEYAIQDPRTGTYLASVTHGQYGPRVFVTDDPTANEWEQAIGPAFPEDADAAVERIWVIQPGEENDVLWAGVAPAALFRSGNGGRTWELNRALWDEPSRPEWEPGAGGMCLHSIATWPGDPARMAVGISAAGVWLTEDGGSSWGRGIKGLVPRYVPEEARESSVALCVHNVHRSPVQPETLYLQFHGGVYRSDDAGDTWQDIGEGLPSDFGFPLVVDPKDSDRAFVIPLRGDFDRVTPDGKVRVFETRDRGGSWGALTEGLPQDDAYLTVLRQAFCHDGRDPLGLFFGSESGEVFGSADRGATWGRLIDHLPPVVSVRASR
ncbi:MAG TPA: MoaD/ThiS family protein [Actinomycetota bacterium]|nr:MoaD/ThiS family protein [Actinomycetota bacterium]